MTTNAKGKPEPIDMNLDPGCFHLVEASAGTGKTWLTAALVLRLVAEEKVAIERILVMTFTRAATAELADRIRARLRDALVALETGVLKELDDTAVIRLLGHPERAQMPDRLRAALGSFDLAPISTIHGFCQRTLARYALEAGLDPRPEFVTDSAPVQERLVADTVASAWAGLDGPSAAILDDLGFEAETLREAAKKLSGAVAATIEPPLSELSNPRDLFDAYRDALTQMRAVIASCGTTCWNAYAASGKDYVKGFGGNQKNAYATLTKAADTGNPSDLGQATLIWFSADEAKVLKPLESFGGYPLIQAFTPLRRLALKLSASSPATVFAHGYRPRWEAALARRGALTYDSMLDNLARALAPGQPGAKHLRDALAGQYDAALVDEFQDTDAAQWIALREVFGSPGKRLIVVGDPKQAIYSFRGADIEVYTAATQHTGALSPAPQRWELPANHRTDPRLLDTLGGLWSTGEPGMGASIGFRPVTATKPDRVTTWGDTDGRTRRPLELRLFTGAMKGANPDEWLVKNDAIGPIAEDCARVCAALIDKMEITPKPAQRTAKEDAEAGVAPALMVTARHIAVLVRTGEQGRLVLQALRKVGLNAVLSSRESVYGGDAARWLVAWLDALSDPGREPPARLLALTPLVGFDPLELGHAVVQQETSDEAPRRGTPAARFEALRRRLRRDAEAWPKRGFMVLFERFLANERAWARVRRTSAGERAATDLRQLIEMLHTEERRERDGVAALAVRLRARFAAAGVSDEGSGDNPAAQHLESDADAVRILTQHVSKGLQFPVVLLPYAWTHSGIRDTGQPLRLPGLPDVNGLPRPRLNIASKQHPSRAPAKIEAQKRVDEEAMRLLYVAMTRAEHHLVAWVGRPKPKSSAPLDLRLGLPADATPPEVRASLAALASTHGTIGWSDVPPLAPPVRMTTTEAGDALTPTFAAPIDHLRNGWRKTSYSGLARDADTDLGADDALLAMLDAPSDALTAPAAGAVLPRGGTVTGSFTHRLLEVIDFTAVSDEESIAATMKTIGQEEGFVDTDQQAIVRALLPGWLDTPLDRVPAASDTPTMPAGFCLRHLPRTQRLDELTFDLSLGRERRIRPDAVRAVFSSIAACEALGKGTRDWARTLGDRKNAQGEPASIVGALRGILNGSIDLVFRTGATQAPVFWVADYKTNAIRGPAEVQRWAETRRDAAGSPPPVAPWRDPLLLALHYSAPLLDWEMAHHAYPLQSLLYTVALDRFLRQRLGGAYRYDTHVGGCLWLFLRGMGGAATPRHAGNTLGVWRERWPLTIVQAVDAALDGATAEDVQILVSDTTPRSRA